MKTPLDMVIDIFDSYYVTEISAELNDDNVLLVHVKYEDDVLGDKYYQVTLAENNLS